MSNFYKIFQAILLSHFPSRFPNPSINSLWQCRFSAFLSLAVRDEYIQKLNVNVRIKTKSPVSNFLGDNLFFKMEKELSHKYGERER